MVSMVWRVTATTSDTPTDTSADTRKKWYRRVGDTGLWMRDTGLGAFGVALLIVVAAAGWGGSTLGLRDFAATHMGYLGATAWLVPATFDGASVGLSFAAFRAAINGRGAPLTRLGIAAFTSLSSWMNYEHILDPAGRRIASLLPVAGVVLLESLLSEARRAYRRRSEGQQERPRIHPLRIVFDWSGTWAIFRAVVMAVPLPDTLARHATATPTSVATTSARHADMDSKPDTDTGAATVTPIHRVPNGATATGEKAATMRGIFDRYVSEGRADELTGALLARPAGANDSLGRRYLAQWRAELATGVAQ